MNSTTDSHPALTAVLSLTGAGVCPRYYFVYAFEVIANFELSSGNDHRHYCGCWSSAVSVKTIGQMVRCLTSCVDLLSSQRNVLSRHHAVYRVECKYNK
jgi:hypothetical protein